MLFSRFFFFTCARISLISPVTSIGKIKPMNFVLCVNNYIVDDYSSALSLAIVVGYILEL